MNKHINAQNPPSQPTDAEHSTFSELQSVTEARKAFPIFSSIATLLITLIHSQLTASETSTTSAAAVRPNILIIMTDDQGYGDLSCHGHPYLRTPALDNLHATSLRLTDFHVSPMCTPSRGQLLFGQDALRNGASAVSRGRFMPDASLHSLADVLLDGGYETGLFGKWHLGRSTPYRPQDRGFETVKTFHGWGMAGPAELFNSYRDGTFIDGVDRKPFNGWATDFWFSEAMKWMQQCSEKNRPFFCLIPTHTPHRPMWTSSDDFERLKKAGVNHTETAGFLAMIEKIDENFGRLETFLTEEKLRENTIVVFLTDNGTAHGENVFNAGLRGKKTSLYEGGHKVPCFIRYPRQGIEGGRDISDLTQVQDLFPTLLDFAGISVGDIQKLDGLSLAPILSDKGNLPDRTLVVQYGDPVYGNAAVMKGAWRLVRNKELYRVDSDPGQQVDISSDHPEILAELKAAYDTWWQGLPATASAYQPIFLPTKIGEGVDLCRDELAHGSGSSTKFVLQPRPEPNGIWYLEAQKAGSYEINIARWPFESNLPITAPLSGYLHSGGYRPFPNDWHLLKQSLPKTVASQLDQIKPVGRALSAQKIRVRISGVEEIIPLKGANASIEIQVQLPAGKTTLQCELLDADSNHIASAQYVHITRVD